MNERQKLLKQISELSAKMQSIYAEMDSTEARAKTATDEKVASDLSAVIRAKAREFDEADAELKTAKEKLARLDKIDAAKAIDTTGAADLNLNPDGTVGEFTPAGKTEVTPDKAKDQRTLSNIFLRYAKAGRRALKNGELESVVSKDRRFLDAEGISNDCLPILLPQNMAKSIIGPTLFDRAKVMLSTDTTGGATDSGSANLIPSNFQANMLQQGVFIPQLYDFVTRVPANGGKVTWPRLEHGTGGGIFGGVAFTWKDTEGADKGETEPTFGKFEIETNELSGWTELSERDLARSFTDLEAFLTLLFNNAVRYEWSKKILLGTGSGQPTGILLAGQYEAIARQIADQVAWKDLAALPYGLSKSNRMGGRYIMADAAEKYLVEQVDTDKRPIFTTSVAGGIVDRIKGYPYDGHEFEDIDLGDTGDVLFGNLSNYFFGVEQDIAIARSEHAEFKKGNIVFRLMCHVGGKPLRTNCFSALDDPAA